MGDEWCVWEGISEGVALTEAKSGECWVGHVVVERG